MALDDQIEKFSKTKKHYEEKAEEYRVKGRQLRGKLKESEAQIERVKAELMAFNRGNLKKIYELEDIIDQI